MDIRRRTLSAIAICCGLFCAVPAHAEVRTFRTPQHQGYRLDYCQAFGQVCGERVATRWCRGNGYEYATDWAVERSIGDVQPTIAIDNDRVCRGSRCDGFASVTCGREERSFRLPSIGAMTRATVITPDRRSTAPRIDSVEVRVLVPGCYQTEPGVLLCGTVHEFQHCRSLLAAGKVLGCKAGLAFDGAFAEPVAAEPSTVGLDVRSRASASVSRDRRGDGRVRGKVDFRIQYDVASQASIAETCLQRDRYLYYPDGPRGGLAEIDDTRDCSVPIEGSFEPHEDHLLNAYDLCAAHGAWGQTITHSIELLVAGLFHLSATTAADGIAGASRIVAPYTTIRAPLEINCRD